MFGENKLSGKDMDELKKLVWDNDGKQIAGLEGIDKFLTDEELESGAPPSRPIQNGMRGTINGFPVSPDPTP